MSNIQEILTSVSNYCGRPNTQTFLSIALDKLYGRLTYYRNLLAITNVNWLLSNFLLTVVPGQDIYNISSQCGDFGKEVMIETYDSTGSVNFSRRDINIVALQELDRQWSGNAQMTAPSTFSNHSAVAAAFYGLPEVFLRIVPSPSASSVYRVWYEPGKAPDNPKLAEVPQFFPQFFDLLALHTASISLSDCEWAEYAHLPIEQRAPMNMAKAAMKMKEIEPEFERLTLVFNDFRLYRNHEQGGTRRAFNDYRNNGRGATRWGW